VQDTFGCQDLENPIESSIQILGVVEGSVRDHEVKSAVGK
jgi:hypothetical protein